MHMHVFVHVHAHVHMHMHVHMYIYMYMYMCLYIYIHTCICIRICLCLCLCLCICICICIRICIRIWQRAVNYRLFPIAFWGRCVLNKNRFCGSLFLHVGSEFVHPNQYWAGLSSGGAVFRLALGPVLPNETGIGDL